MYKTLSQTAYVIENVVKLVFSIMTFILLKNPEKLSIVSATYVHILFFFGMVGLFLAHISRDFQWSMDIWLSFQSLVIILQSIFGVLMWFDEKKFSEFHTITIIYALLDVFALLLIKEWIMKSSQETFGNSAVRSTSTRIDPDQTTQINFDLENV